MVVRLDILAGDFNKNIRDVFNNGELSKALWSVACKTNETNSNSYRNNNSIDYILINKDKHIKVEECNSIWNGKLQREKDLTERYRNGNFPEHPSDHGILYAKLNVHNTPLGVVTWNVMTQGLLRTQGHRINKIVHEQLNDVLYHLNNIFNSTNIDIVCLQEFGGAAVWDRYYNIPSLNKQLHNLNFINGSRLHPERPTHRQIKINDKLKHELSNPNTWVLVNNNLGRVIFVRGNIIDFEKLRTVNISRWNDTQSGRQTTFGNIYLHKGNTSINLSVGSRHSQYDVETPALAHSTKVSKAEGGSKKSRKRKRYLLKKSRKLRKFRKFRKFRKSRKLI